MQTRVQSQWIATADERRATLYSFRTTSGGAWHAEARKSIENPWENYHEHHRPSALGRGPTANAAQHFASSGHEEAEEHRRFARKVAQWLEQLTAELHIDQMSLFAASRFLGELRRELNQLTCQIDLLEGELTRLSAPELCEQPAILDALRRHGKPDRHRM